MAAMVRNAGELAAKPDLDESAAKVAAYTWGIDAFRDAVLIAWARSGRAGGDAHFARLAALPERFVPPEFPLSGRDLIDVGYQPGPELGAVLAHLEADWLAQGFAPGRVKLLELARATLPRAENS